MKTGSLAASSLALLLLATGASAQASAPSIAADPLVAAFRDPPMSARPRTWWHWLNGNITQDGIDKDLEWMKRAGLGGVQTFDASLGTPQVVKDRIAYMTPAWKAAFAHAADTAKRLGLELAISSSPGWSETGGPWVAPADAMKKLVWSETDVDGGRRFAGRLAAPADVTGPYGSARFLDPLAAFGGQTGATIPTASGDIRVFAVPISASTMPTPIATDQTGAAIDATALTDKREDTSVAIPRGSATSPAVILLTYPTPQTIRTATLFLPGAVPPFGDPEFLPRLERQTTSGWTPIASVPLGNVPTTIAFPPVTSRRFRLVLRPNDAPRLPGLANPAPGAVVAGVFPSGPAPTTIPIGTLRLSADPAIDRFEAKAGFATVEDYYALGSTAPDRSGIPTSSVIDLTSRMRADGTLDWTPPPGRWRIVRLGWSLVGTTNHPAAPESTGLEVDKYDATAVRGYISHYFDTYRDERHGPGKGIDALVTDSIESGDANWTPRMIDRFRQLRGYDPTPWLPALTGAVIGSRAESDAFLYDYRRTLSDLIASEHYGTIATVAHENGLKVYGEALENGRPQLGDDIAMRSHTDVPMAAMWAFGKGEPPRTTLMGDILGAASVAHVYGQNLVASESFTASFSPWAFAPADLRRVADLEFALGVNRPVIHTSVLSPMDDKEPGLSLAIFGQYFNRHDTWSGMARPWIDYLARSSFLLQQGRHVADIAYFFGEEAPLTALYLRAPLADVPADRGIDFVDADVIANQLSVSQGDLVAKGGARYRLLYLGGSSRRMTLATLRRIAVLAEAGATVLGEAPIGSPSLDDPAAFRALVGQLWAGGAETKVGQGRVIAGHDIAAALGGFGPDFSYAGRKGDILFQHRVFPGGDIYFLSNRSEKAIATDGRFRVTGKAPEIWHADTGKSAPISYRTDGGETVVPLAMAPEESFFVLFRHPTTAPAATIAPVVTTAVASLDGPWQISFQPGRGAPGAVTLPHLAGLDQQPQPGVKYFSGVATYMSRFTLPAESVGSGRLMLDLGRIGDVAEVDVNGQSVGTAWHTPYRVDIGAAVHPGVNRIEVRVADLWVNRLIGDAQPGAAKIAFVAAPTYRPDAPLRPAGLIGPVTILSEPEGE